MPPDDLDGSEPSGVESLARDALDNLVHQFARPLDFLRELVQNSIDAGTPRIEVAVEFEAAEDAEEPGVLTVHVQDWGEGMDEAIIDAQLTRMFSSTKEDDLTKIGKFGVGFTSIFAMRPQAVLLVTGRHGESWELLFHADRSFDKVRIAEPVTGTRISLFKELPQGEVAAFVAEARWVLGYWCEHSGVPVSFLDATGAAEEAPVVAAADPFAAFEVGAVGGDTGPGPEVVSRPFELDAELDLELEVDGVTVLVGVSESPGYGFYNGGLTLVSTRDRECLGEHEARLAHLSLKVKYDRLEHTLTRDNVLRDRNWQKAMAVASQAAEALGLELLAHIEDLVRAGEDPGPWHAHLAREVEASAMRRRLPDLAERIWLSDRAGRALSLAEVERQERRLEVVLLDGGGPRLVAALEARGLHLLPAHPGTIALLHATWVRPWLSLGQTARRLRRAEEVYLLPELLEAAHLPEHERVMLRHAQAMLGEVAGRRLSLRLGRFTSHQGLPLALEGPEDGGVFAVPRGRASILPTTLRRRCLLLNRQHPSWRAHTAAAREDPVLGAFGVLQAALVEEGLEDDDLAAQLALVAAGRLGGPRE